MGSIEGSMLQICAICNEAFVDEPSLAIHLKIHHPTEPKLEGDEEEEHLVTLYACERCGLTFPSDESFFKHQAGCASNVVIQEEEQQQPQPPTTPKKIYKCPKCDYTSRYRQNRNSHERRHDCRYSCQCEVCGVGFYARNIYQEHMLACHSGSDKKPFQCELCTATFKYRQGLRLHGKIHQPDYVPPPKKHACEICQKRFCRRQVLMVHMRTHGNMGGPLNEYVCPVCGKAVSSKTYLTVHLRKHTGEKPHICEFCGKGFISQNYLSVHKRTHTGERPHRCAVCQKTFTQRTTLVVHQRSHTGQRPYPCTFCEKTFASKTMLNSHLKTHAKQTARAQQDQETQLHLQQQRLLLSPEQEEAIMLQQQQHHQIVAAEEIVTLNNEIALTSEVTLTPS